MKNKEKSDLLLKDLSPRLPFGVKIEFGDGSIETLKGIWYDEDEGWQVDGEKTSSCLFAVKPYLLPLSSMTEEQKIECFRGTDIELDEFNEIWSRFPISDTDIPITNLPNWLKVLDWLNSHYFDYRDLIGEDDNSIALNATGLNIY